MALRQIMRLRGYSVMTNVLEDHTTDMELITLVCSSLLEQSHLTFCYNTSGTGKYDKMAIGQPE